MILVRASHPTFMYGLGKPQPHILVNLFNHQNKFFMTEGLDAGWDPLCLDLRVLTVRKYLRLEKI